MSDRHKEYVLVACRFQFDPTFASTVFIRKARPDWQVGRINLPGGKVEPGEEPKAAALRELMEETGLYVEPSDLHYAGEMSGSGWTIHVYRAEIWGRQVLHVNDDEPAFRDLITSVLRDADCLPSLRILLPMIVSETPFTITCLAPNDVQLPLTFTVML